MTGVGEKRSASGKANVACSLCVVVELARAPVQVLIVTVACCAGDCAGTGALRGMNRRLRNTTCCAALDSASMSRKHRTSTRYCQVRLRGATCGARAAHTSASVVCVDDETMVSPSNATGDRAGAGGAGAGGGGGIDAMGELHARLAAMAGSEAAGASRECPVALAARYHWR